MAWRSSIKIDKASLPEVSERGPYPFVRRGWWVHMHRRETWPIQTSRVFVRRNSTLEYKGNETQSNGQKFVEVVNGFWCCKYFGVSCIQRENLLNYLFSGMVAHIWIRRFVPYIGICGGPCEHIILSWVLSFRQTIGMLSILDFGLSRLTVFWISSSIRARPR